MNRGTLSGLILALCAGLCSPAHADKKKTYAVLTAVSAVLAGGGVALTTVGGLQWNGAPSAPTVTAYDRMQNLGRPLIGTGIAAMAIFTPLSLMFGYFWAGEASIQKTPALGLGPISGGAGLSWGF